MLRLFIAAEIPEAQREAVDSVVAPLRGTLSGARWTGEAGWHVTLKFLGSVTGERLELVSGICRSVAAAAPGPAEVRLTGLGAFPSPGRARVLWVGLAEPAGVLVGAAAGLEERFRAEGFPAEQRPWRPHLTVARMKVPGPVDLLDAEIGASPFTVVELVLFSSHLRPTGAVYEALGRYPLGG
ncbi:MAG: RNA 2',3'-cyclic phosphodiesterase [Actinomycetota bacterium]